MATTPVLQNYNTPTLPQLDGGDPIFWRNQLQQISKSMNLLVGQSNKHTSAIASVVSYGADPTGTNDSAPALNAALAALSGTGGIVYFPPGLYKFLSAITYTFSGNIFSVTLEGAGMDASVLYWPSGNGISFTLSQPGQTFHLRGLTFATGSVNTSIGFQASQSSQLGDVGQNEIISCCFRGLDLVGLTNNWSFCVATVGVTNINYISSMFYGPSAGTSTIGVSIAGVAGGTNKYGVIFNFWGCSFFVCEFGILIGTWAQGVTVDACNFEFGNYGVTVAGGAVNVSQINVTNSQFNTKLDQISLNAPVVALMATNNLIYVPTSPAAHGIIWNSTGIQNVITGNVFSGFPTSTQAGVGIQTTSGQSVSVTSIAGNVFYNLTTGADLVGASSFNVQANVYNTVTAKAINVGSNSVGEWLAWMPTVSAGSGTITTSTALGRYAVYDKTATFEAQINITTNGTGAAYVGFTLPLAASSAGANTGCGRDTSGVTGKALALQINGGATVAAILNYDGTYPGANGVNLVVSGSYEIP